MREFFIDNQQVQIQFIIERFSGPASRHGILTPPFQVALYLPRRHNGPSTEHLYSTQPLNTAHVNSFPVSGRNVDVRLPGKGNSKSHGARSVHQIITMIKWIRTSRLPIKKSPPVRWRCWSSLRRCALAAPRTPRSVYLVHPEPFSVTSRDPG